LGVKIQGNKRMAKLKKVSLKPLKKVAHINAVIISPISIRLQSMKFAVDMAMIQLSHICL
jgi:hypothetical protein